MAALSTPKFLRPNIASLMVEIPFVIALQLWQLWLLITCWLGSSQGPRWQTTVDLHLCFPWVSPRMSLLEITLHFDSMYPISAYLYWFRANTMLNDDHKTQFSSWFDSQWSPYFVGQIPILFSNPYSSLLNSVAQAALRTLQGRPRAQPSSCPHSAATTSLSWAAGNAPATRRFSGVDGGWNLPGGVQGEQWKKPPGPPKLGHNRLRV